MKLLGHSARCALALLLASVLLLSGCSSSSKPIESTELEMTVVGSCEGYDIYYDELRYVTLSYKDIMESYYGEGIWDDAATAAQYLPELREHVMKNLTANYAVLAHCETFMIDTDADPIQDAVQESIDQMVDQIGGREAYRKALAEMYLTDRLVRFTIGTDVCHTELMYAMMDIDLIESDQLEFLTYAQEGGFCAVYHIYIANDEGESIEDNRKKAEEALAKLRSGTEMKKMLGSIYNEDVYLVSDPYYFTHGEYDEAYEETAFNLEIGEISDIVQTEDGFYILQRQALDQDYLVANLVELMQRYQYASVESLVRDLQKELTVELNDFGKSLDLLAITMAEEN
jgi:foldase protein PrsA